MQDAEQGSDAQDGENVCSSDKGTKKTFRGRTTESDTKKNARRKAKRAAKRAADAADDELIQVAINLNDSLPAKLPEEVAPSSDKGRKKTSKKKCAHDLCDKLAQSDGKGGCEFCSKHGGYFCLPNQPGS